MSARVLCLGSGAVTGGAWELGVLIGLADEGIDLASGADRVIGTSVGALLAAHLGLARPPVQLADELLELQVAARYLPRVLARLGVAQVWPSRRHALVWLGKAATGGGWEPQHGEQWVATLSPGLAGKPWPAGLEIVATDARNGRPAYFTATSGVPLERAVAASCALPGVFPPVLVEGRPHFDGALRSLANVDLAAGGEVVVALAPYGFSVRSYRRPREQARALAAPRVMVLEPDTASRRAMGVDPVSPVHRKRAIAGGREYGLRHAGLVRAAWDWPG